MSDTLRSIVPVWMPSASAKIKRYNFPDNGGIGFLYGTSIGDCDDGNDRFVASNVDIISAKQNNPSCFSPGNDIQCSLPFLPPNADANSMNETFAKQNAGKPLSALNTQTFVNWRKRNITKPKMLKDLKAVYDQLGTSDKLHLDIPSYVIDIAKSIPDIYLDNKMILDDVLSSGGGICWLQSMPCGQTYDGLLYSSGQDMKSLVYVPTCVDTNSLLFLPDNDSRKVKLFSKKIYQVTAVEMDNHFYGVRMAKNLEIGIIKVDSEDEVCFQEICSKPTKSYITDICLSPFIPEYLFITENGTVKIVDLEEGKEMEKYKNFGLSSESSNFELKQVWSSCRFASNPRCFVCTKPDAFFLMDRRVGCRRVSTLLSSVSAAVIYNEKFGCYEKSYSNTNLHYVGSCHSLFLVDERYPNHPVISWKHQLISPPKYCSAVVWSRDSNSTINEAVVLASRRRQETAAFHVRHTEGDTQFSYSVSPTLHIPCPRDMVNSLHERGSNLDIATSLLRKLPLHGLCCAIPADKRLIVFQQTADGNVYHQPFDYIQRSKNRQKSEGFKPSIANDQVEECLQWLEAAFSQMRAKDSLPNTEQKETVDIKTTFNLMVEPERHSHNCPFCCQCSREEIGDIIVDPGEVDKVCPKCNIQIGFAKTLIEGVHESKSIVGQYPVTSVKNCSVPFFAGKIDDNIASASFPSVAQMLNKWKQKIESATDKKETMGEDPSTRVTRNIVSTAPTDSSVIYEPITSQSENSVTCINGIEPFEMFDASQGFDPVISSQRQSSLGIDIDVIPPTQFTATSPITGSVKKVSAKKPLNRKLAADKLRTALKFDGF